ncbi:fimbrial biogenesis chaperone [Kangiella taiwanensis]|uniref:fimbrial biogenesis chaperone n=1 Tax=Kangiella taiwanensis TaxID=1079179 RepID=UPI001CBBEB02|nr:fimbria/pilus periplasmic chaperone [Kangiella taiwanensis]
MYRTITFCIALLAALFNSSAFSAQSGLQPKLAISPSRVVLQPDEVKTTKSVTVLNLGAKPMQVEVSVQNWDFDEDNNYRALPPTPQSLDQWLIINPVRLTIPAKGQQTVRMAVRPKAKPDDGEHRAMVFFKQLRADDAKGVNVLFNVGVPVYAFFGDVKRVATLHSMSYLNERQSLQFDITSSGNAYVRPEGFYMIVQAEQEGERKNERDILQMLDGKTGEVKGKKPLATGKINSKPVFAGNRRVVEGGIALKDAIKEKLPEQYALAVKVDIAGTLYEKVYYIKKDK